jgi:hypothetical protein
MPTCDIERLKRRTPGMLKVSGLTELMHPPWLRGDHAPHGMEIELPACRGVSSLRRIAGLFDRERTREN